MSTLVANSPNSGILCGHSSLLDTCKLITHSHSVKNQSGKENVVNRLQNVHCSPYFFERKGYELQHEISNNDIMWYVRQAKPQLSLRISLI